MTAIERATWIQALDRDIAAMGIDLALLKAGTSVSTYSRWKARLADGGIDALVEHSPTGRPAKVVLTEAEAQALRVAYIASNRTRTRGSMMAAARHVARDLDSPLSGAVRAAILETRRSGRLPAPIRQAMKEVSAAHVLRYRDTKHGLNQGVYAPGTMRMTMDADGSIRRLRAGERQSWDDASVNFGVWVLWPLGDCKCSRRWGCRVARFQLLLGIDDATDYCVGFEYVMRRQDSYRAEDVVHALHRVWSLSGHVPDTYLHEGGAWQAERTLQFVGAAGAGEYSAKGRPNQKLVEGYFNRLWTQLSMELPSGQVGRFRGEMTAENALWRRCREGIADPRQHFPSLDEAINAITRAVVRLNHEPVESRQYGSWVPVERYAEEMAARAARAMPAGLAYYALRERATRKVKNYGQVQVRADSPLGWPHTYHFASAALAPLHGREVQVCFDPATAASAGAVIVVDGKRLPERAQCISAAPELLAASAGEYEMRWNWDGVEKAKAVKRATRLQVGREVRALDPRGRFAAESHRVDEDAAGLPGLEIGPATAAVSMPAPSEAEQGQLDEIDFAELERLAGVVACAG